MACCGTTWQYRLVQAHVPKQYMQYPHPYDAPAVSGVYLSTSGVREVWCCIL